MVAKLYERRLAGDGPSIADWESAAESAARSAAYSQMADKLIELLSDKI